MEKTTIGAISTPLGSGGIGIIRISGNQSVPIVEKMFSSYSGKKIAHLGGYQGMLGEIKKQGETIDQAIVTRFIAPKSYTGEDVVEISSHGGSWVTSQILRFCFELGVEPAQPGEFTKRAFLNGKMDLLEAEAVMDIINAQGTASLKAANNLRQGSLSTAVNVIVEKLLARSAHISAWMDYPDEELEEVDEKELAHELALSLAEIEKILATYDYGKIVRNGITTAIVGKPNVGKSTLMNLLSGYELSIVSPIPGTTRDVVREQIRLGNLVLQLSDTAGIRETEDTIEKVGVERSKEQIRGAQLVLALFDYSQPLDKEDRELMELLDDKQTIVLINKSDLADKIDTVFLEEKFSHVILVSAKNQKGLENLESTIEDVLQLNRINQGDSAIITSERQRQSLIQAKEAVEEAVAALQLGVTLDAVDVCIVAALDVLLSLSGKRVEEEIIDQVFAHFCVGK